MNYYITELLHMQQHLKQCFKFTLTGIFEKYFGKTRECLHTGSLHSLIKHVGAGRIFKSYANH